MWQTFLSWITMHKTDLQRIQDQLVELLKEIGATVTDEQQASRLSGKVKSVMNDVAQAGSNADTFHGEARRAAGDEKIGPGESVHDGETGETVGPKTGIAGETQFFGSGTGDGKGSDSGSGFVTVESIEVQGGAIRSGDVVLSSSDTKMTVEEIRTNEAGTTLVCCRWFQGSAVENGSFSPSSLRKFSELPGSPPDNESGSVPAATPST